MNTHHMDMGLTLIVGEIIQISPTNLNKKHQDQVQKVISKATKKIPTMLMDVSEKQIVLMVLKKNRNEMVPTDTILKIGDPYKNKILEEHIGYAMGNPDSIPPLLRIPGQENIMVAIHYPDPEHNNFWFPKHIQAHINAISYNAKKSQYNKSFIFGGPSVGKTSLATTIASNIGRPWVQLSPKYAVIDQEKIVDTILTITKIADQRGLTLVWDDIDETLAMMSTPIRTSEDDEPIVKNRLYYWVVDFLKHYKWPVVVTTSGHFPMNHIISECDMFFSLDFGPEMTKEIWNTLCPTATQLADEVAGSGMPFGMINKIKKQAEMLARAHNRKTPNYEDYVLCITNIGSDKKNKLGFGL